MDDPELDTLLRRGAPRPPAGSGTTAELMAREITRGAAAPHRRGRRRLVALAAVAALALTGAGTTAAYQLSIPPFQTLEEGVGRVLRPAEVSWTNSLGRRVDCLAFAEYRNLDADQRRAMETIALDPRWRGYGDRVLAERGASQAPPEAQAVAVTDALNDDLWRAARDVVPGLVFMAESKGPVYTGSAVSCAGPGGVDGRP